MNFTKRDDSLKQKKEYLLISCGTNPDTLMFMAEGDSECHNGGRSSPSPQVK